MMNRLIPILFLLCFAGCTQPAATDATATAPKPAMRALGESITTEDVHSDEFIGFEIRRRIDTAGGSETVGVIVEVNDGVVTLRGVAPNIAATWRAEAAARSVKGTKQVDNQIIIVRAGP